MSEKNKCVFLSILTILKNATLIIPFIEGVISTIHKAVHPDSVEKQVFKDESLKPTADGYNYRDDEH